MVAEVRVLVAAALGSIVAPILEDSLGATVHCAGDPAQVRRAIEGRVRFDVVLTDLIWNDLALEYQFDGLDVIAILRELDRTAPVVIATQGHGVERDHLDEAVTQAEVVGVYRKATGPGPLLRAVKLAAEGQRLPAREYPTGVPTAPAPICQYFGAGRRGATTARLAGAIAARRASDAASLQTATSMPLNTANKLTTYLGPLILARREHAPELPLTSQVVYRWCGEHAHYILSWCRRHGHADVVGQSPMSLGALPAWR